MDKTKQEVPDDFPVVNTESVPDVFLGIENKESVTEQAMHLLANPPDEIIMIYRKHGDSFGFYSSGYTSLATTLGVIEFMKQILWEKYMNRAVD